MSKNLSFRISNLWIKNQLQIRMCIIYIPLHLILFLTFGKESILSEIPRCKEINLEICHDKKEAQLNGYLYP